MATTTIFTLFTFALASSVSAVAVGQQDAALNLARDVPSATFEKRGGPATTTYYAPANTYWPSGNRFLTLDNGDYFILQGDGNFVVYDANNNRLWNSYVFDSACGSNRCHLQFQGDGNLVAVDYGVSPPHPFWASGSQGHPGSDGSQIPQGYELVFRDNYPYIIIQDQKHEPVWIATGTSGHVGGTS